MRLAIYLAVVVELVLSYTTRPPCCRDHLGTPTCQRLNRVNPRMFSRRCNTDAEFRLIQCCSSCNKSGKAMAYDLVARSLTSENCFDRYGSLFCSRFVNGTNIFEPQNTWSCDGENPQIAFRACRQSCGFCNFSIVHYTIANAQNACKTVSSGSKDTLLMKKYTKDRRYF